MGGNAFKREAPGGFRGATARVGKGGVTPAEALGTER